VSITFTEIATYAGLLAEYGEVLPPSELPLESTGLKLTPVTLAISLTAVPPLTDRVQLPEPLAGKLQLHATVSVVAPPVPGTGTVRLTEALVVPQANEVVVLGTTERRSRVSRATPTSSWAAAAVRLAAVFC
jgi:hypothetical protein